MNEFPGVIDYVEQMKLKFIEDFSLPNSLLRNQSQPIEPKQHFEYFKFLLNQFISESFNEQIIDEILCLTILTPRYPSEIFNFFLNPEVIYQIISRSNQLENREKIFHSFVQFLLPQEIRLSEQLIDTVTNLAKIDAINRLKEFWANLNSLQKIANPKQNKNNAFPDNIDEVITQKVSTIFQNLRGYRDTRKKSNFLIPLPSFAFFPIIEYVSQILADIDSTNSLPLLTLLAIEPLFAFSMVEKLPPPISFNILPPLSMVYQVQVPIPHSFVSMYRPILVPIFNLLGLFSKYESPEHACMKYQEYLNQKFIDKAEHEGPKTNTTINLDLSQFHHKDSILNFRLSIRKICQNFLNAIESGPVGRDALALCLLSLYRTEQNSYIAKRFYNYVSLDNSFQSIEHDIIVSGFMFAFDSAPFPSTTVLLKSEPLLFKALSTVRRNYCMSLSPPRITHLKELNDEDEIDLIDDFLDENDESPENSQYEYDIRKKNPFSTKIDTIVRCVAGNDPGISLLSSAYCLIHTYSSDRQLNSQSELNKKTKAKRKSRRLSRSYWSRLRNKSYCVNNNVMNVLKELSTKLNNPDHFIAFCSLVEAHAKKTFTRDIPDNSKSFTKHASTIALKLMSFPSSTFPPWHYFSLLRENALDAIEKAASFDHLVMLMRDPLASTLSLLGSTFLMDRILSDSKSNISKYIKVLQEGKEPAPPEPEENNTEIEEKSPIPVQLVTVPSSLCESVTIPPAAEFFPVNQPTVENFHLQSPISNENNSISMNLTNQPPFINLQPVMNPLTQSLFGQQSSPSLISSFTQNLPQSSLSLTNQSPLTQLHQNTQQQIAQTSSQPQVNANNHPQSQLNTINQPQQQLNALSKPIVMTNQQMSVFNPYIQQTMNSINQINRTENPTTNIQSSNQQPQSASHNNQSQQILNQPTNSTMNPIQNTLSKHNIPSPQTPTQTNQQNQQSQPNQPSFNQTPQQALNPIYQQSTLNQNIQQSTINPIYQQTAINTINQQSSINPINQQSSLNTINQQSTLNPINQQSQPLMNSINTATQQTLNQINMKPSNPPLNQLNQSAKLLSPLTQLNQTMPPLNQTAQSLNQINQPMPPFTQPNQQTMQQFTQSVNPISQTTPTINQQPTVPQHPFQLHQENQANQPSFDQIKSQQQNNEQVEPAQTRKDKQPVETNPEVHPELQPPSLSFSFNTQAPNSLVSYPNQRINPLMQQQQQRLPFSLSGETLVSMLTPGNILTNTMLSNPALYNNNVNTNQQSFVPTDMSSKQNSTTQPANTLSINTTTQLNTEPIQPNNEQNEPKQEELVDVSHDAQIALLQQKEENLKSRNLRERRKVRTSSPPPSTGRGRGRGRRGRGRGASRGARANASSSHASQKNEQETLTAKGILNELRMSRERQLPPELLDFDFSRCYCYSMSYLTNCATKLAVHELPQSYRSLLALTNFSAFSITNNDGTETQCQPLFEDSLMNEIERLSTLYGYRFFLRISTALMQSSSKFPEFLASFPNHARKYLGIILEVVSNADEEDIPKFASFIWVWRSLGVCINFANLYPTEIAYLIGLSYKADPNSEFFFKSLAIIIINYQLAQANVPNSQSDEFVKELNMQEWDKTPLFTMFVQSLPHRYNYLISGTPSHSNEALDVPNKNESLPIEQCVEELTGRLFAATYE